ncbi:type 4a pilus biogenesis protein PilO [Pseudomonas japonica]|uniref:Tfp pilus assembly protein PilO n=1 Tax=Pseudomonas japonica TaxID=256466 RepID=A0A239CHN6_9PSED|nr:type 4a pilus biogenesis protein PilO [Pseudomonas japonica]SNS19715.1 Tfp pilus assembly protein PilO [Pseudomonas japonica]
MNLSLIDDAVDWSALLRWSWLAKSLLLAVCLLAFPVTGHGIWGREWYVEVVRERARNEQSQQQWQTGSAQVERLAAHETKNRELQDDLERRRRELFDADGLASLLQSLARSGMGLSFEQVEVLEPEVGPHHVRLPLRVQVLGEYPSLKRFLAELAGLDMLVTLHELQLAVADELSPGALRLQLQLHAYRALDVQALADQAAPVSARPRNPFEPVESLVTGGASLSLEQARMVGYLRDRKGQVALVRWGDKVHLLREGDPLGPGRVSAIGEERMELVGATDGAAGIPRVLTLLSPARE